VDDALDDDDDADAVDDDDDAAAVDLPQSPPQEDDAAAVALPQSPPQKDDATAVKDAPPQDADAEAINTHFAAVAGPLSTLACTMFPADAVLHFDPDGLVRYYPTFAKHYANKDWDAFRTSGSSGLFEEGPGITVPPALSGRTFLGAPFHVKSRVGDTVVFLAPSTTKDNYVYVTNGTYRGFVGDGTPPMTHMPIDWHKTSDYHTKATAAGKAHSESP